MPPASAAVRKSSVMTTDSQHRRQSGRSGRQISRPLNYYARPYGSMGGAQEEAEDNNPPGFFPAITFFADAVTALPKEFQRHVSLMKEVEAKVYGPTEALKQVSSKILSMPAPRRKIHEPTMQGLLSFTAPGSAAASLNGSVVNGSSSLPNSHRTGDALALEHASTSSHVVDDQADIARRTEFANVRGLINNILFNLDEKNTVMAEANRALAHQISRMTSVLPYVEQEVSEEARYGNANHWAYQDNRTKKQPGHGASHERTRRDVAATSVLAAASAAVHDSDIAAARGEVRREGKKTKSQQHQQQQQHQNHLQHQQQQQQHVDSDFDNRPARKTQASKARDQKAAGLGISNGANPAGAAPAKRRKVDQVAAAPAMERSLSGALKNARAKNNNNSPRSTPAAEQVKPKKKPGPAPGTQVKKRYIDNLDQATALPVQKTDAPAHRTNGVNSGANTPKNGASPVLSAAQMHLEPALQRPGSSRMRQNSSTSNLQYSLTTTKETSGPGSVADNRSVTNGNGTPAPESSVPTANKDNNGDTGHAEEDRMQVDKAERTSNLKHEDTTMSDTGGDAAASRAGGRTPKVATPRLDAGGLAESMGMVRTRSNRGKDTSSNNGSVTRGSASTSETRDDSQTRSNGRKGHRKTGSGAHILKQIASFNRSPVMDRHKDVNGDDVSDMDYDSEPLEDQPAGQTRSRTHSRNRSVQPRSTKTSRRTARSETRTAHSRSRVRSPEPAPAPPAPPEPEVQPEPAAEEEEEEEEEEEALAEAEAADDEDEDGGEDDPNEQKYCYCGQGSFGEMIACDNEDCTMEWFHLDCTGLRSAPAENVKWYCDVCKEAMHLDGPGKRKGRPGSARGAVREGKYQRQ